MVARSHDVHLTDYPRIIGTSAEGDHNVWVTGSWKKKTIILHYSNKIPYFVDDWKISGNSGECSSGITMVGLQKFGNSDERSLGTTAFGHHYNRVTSSWKIKNLVFLGQDPDLAQ